jgi:hypothetical protein
MDPPRDLYEWYRTVSNHHENENKNENGASPRPSRKKGSAEE